MSQKSKNNSGAKVRNSLRPFFLNKKRVPFWKQIQAVRIETPISDFPLILSIVEENPHYPFAGLGNTFPNNALEIPNARFHGLRPLALSRELAIQVARLNFHAEKLCRGLLSLAHINDLLAESRYLEAEQFIAQHKLEFGFSLSILKKELFLGLNEGGLSGLSRRFTRLTKDVESRAWALLAKFFYDVLDPAYPPDSALRTWFSIAASRPETSDWYARILMDELIDYSEKDEDVASAILRYGSTSLLDLILQVWKKKGIYESDDHIQLAFKRLDTALKTTLTDRFTETRIAIPDAYKTAEKSPTDIDLYRTSIAFSEVTNITVWRCRLTMLLTGFVPKREILSNDKIKGIFIEAAKRVVENPGQLPRLICDIPTGNEAVAAFLGTVNHPYLSSGIAAEGVRQMSKTGIKDVQGLSSLLSSSENIHAYVEQVIFDKLLAFPDAEQSPLLSFLLREMIYRKSRTADNELERRMAFMAQFKDNEHQSITTYLNGLLAQDKNVALFVAKLCSRSFLEKLFMLMASVKDVIEEQLSIARWKRTSFPEIPRDLDDDIEALERELANLEARSDLDSTRVHVDEDGLKEWFINTQSGNVSRYIQTVLSEGPNHQPVPMLTFYSNKDRGQGEDEDFTKDAKIGSEFILVAIMDATLKAFSSDKTFGLDAYLSRRIRHGTLSGLVITPLARVMKKMVETVSATSPVPEDDPSSVQYLAIEWRRYLTTELDHVRREVIQIKSGTTPKGAIRASWESAGNIQHLDAMIARVRQKVIETGGRTDIFSEIYAYCWDCLEPDLAQLRLYLVRDFFPRAAANLQLLYSDLSASQSKPARNFIQELTEVLSSRLQDVVGWFIRPVFRQNEYNLKILITSTFSIVRELDDTYSFKERIEIEGNPTLNRIGFDVFGDVLFVLIGNAAKHGRKDGTISVKASPFPGDIKTVQLEVTSEVSDLGALERSLDRLNAVRAADAIMIDQAAVGEGFSGIRKLIGLLRRIKSQHVSLNYTSSKANLTITFRVVLPTEILSSRGER